MTLDLTKCQRGQKLRYRDGSIGTFIAYVPELKANRQVITLYDGSTVTTAADGSFYGNDREHPADIIGIVETVTYPEIWLVRYLDGILGVCCEKDEAERRLIAVPTAIITHLPAEEREK